MAKIKEDYPLPYDRTCMHEFVVEGAWEDVPDIHALDIAKRLMDYGFHPPTNYFPLIVHEALMIEPTETESMQTLDAFAAAMKPLPKKPAKIRNSCIRHRITHPSAAATKSKPPGIWCSAAGCRNKTNR